MKINNKLIVAVSCVSSVAVIGMVIIKMILKFKNCFDELNHNIKDLNKILVHIK